MPTPLDPAATVRIHALESLRLHLKVDLRVYIGRLQRNMTQPRADGVDVDAATKQMNGACVPAISVEI